MTATTQYAITEGVEHAGFKNTITLTVEGEGVQAFARRTSQSTDDGKVYGYVVVTADGEEAPDGLYTKTEAVARMERIADPRVFKAEGLAEDEDLADAGAALIADAEETVEEKRAEERAASRALKDGERKRDDDGNVIVHIWDDLGMDMFAVRRKWEAERNLSVTTKRGGPFGRKDVRARVEALITAKSQFMTVEDARLLTLVVHSPLDIARQEGRVDVTSTIQLWHAGRNEERAEAFRAALDDIEAGRPHSRVAPGF